jgi:hypothetical protein
MGRPDLVLAACLQVARILSWGMGEEGSESVMTKLELIGIKKLQNSAQLLVAFKNSSYDHCFICAHILAVLQL